jgi:hypothetical protein
MQPRDRGLLQAALALLYQQDELEAREKLRRDKEKRRKQAEQAAAESADAAAFSALFLEPQAAALSLKEAAAAAAAVPSRSHSRSDASLPDSLASSPGLKPSSSTVPPPASASIPPPLSSECSVCYSSFGSEWEGVTCVRVRASLCGHASLCAECFTTYLRSCVQEGIVMPFIRCPEPGCKLPLDHRDLASRAPSLSQAQVFESQYEHERELAIRRDERAVERKAARKAAAVAAAAAEAGLLASQPSAWPPASSSSAVADAADHEEISADSLLFLDSDSDDHETDRRVARRGSKVASGSPRRKASRFQQQQRRKSSSASSSECADNAVAASGALVASAPAVAGTDALLIPPIAPPMNVASSALPDYFLPNDLLLQLARLHLHKALHQCRDWLPCGTHPLGSGDEAATAADAKAKEEVPAAAVAVDGDNAAGDGDSSEERKSDDDDSSPSPAPPAAAAPSIAAPSATRSSSSPACPFGFVLAPAWTAAGKAKDKLKKCDHCGELQIVVNKSAPMAAVAHDPDMQAMLDAGTLRPCPQCDALNMKDYGLCNVLQCHTCQIWWNWESRATGKSAQALKDLARRTGTMWLPGELQYNTTLQRTNLPAFIDLLKRNGVEYDPNFVRGASHSKII